MLTVSILTAGDTPLSDPSYRMVGVPDGLGAYGTGGNRFQLLMNHELSSNTGSVHAHGQSGAFVSEWSIRRSDLAVLDGADLIQNTHLVTGGPAFSPFLLGRSGATLGLLLQRQRPEPRAAVHERRGVRQRGPRARARADRTLEG
ncbi:MAG: hypothetical protein IPJ19_05425 [Planctomycetes bacterium]|nr:hypothetical protein [Planctomycetota bacterium]